jgi:2'-5' RNA ligase
MDEIRTFVAIELDEAIQHELRQIQDSLRRWLGSSPVRWVNPTGIHLTLKFLGNVPAPQIDEIKTALQQACAGFCPFELTVAGLGCFPNLTRPNVVWVGVQGDLAALQRLRDSVEQHIAPLGYPTERREFKPHLTLGRVKNARPAEARRVGDAVREVEETVIGTLHAGEVSLMRSDLTPHGASYTQLLGVRLEVGS